jgi:hypothetical protein
MKLILVILIATMPFIVSSFALSDEKPALRNNLKSDSKSHADYKAIKLAEQNQAFGILEFGEGTALFYTKFDLMVEQGLINKKDDQYSLKIKNIDYMISFLGTMDDKINCISIRGYPHYNVNQKLENDWETIAEYFLNIYGPADKSYYKKLPPKLLFVGKGNCIVTHVWHCGSKSVVITLRTATEKEKTASGLYGINIYYIYFVSCYIYNNQAMERELKANQDWLRHHGMDYKDSDFWYYKIRNYVKEKGK